MNLTPEQMEQGRRNFLKVLAGTPALREHRRLVKEALAARTPPPPPPAEDWRPSTVRLVVVGLIGGAVFAGLVCYQVVELLRRRPSVRPPAAGR